MTDPPVEAFPAQREAELLERARQAFAMQQQGNLGEAAKIYQEILMVDEDQFYANHFLGVIAARTGQFDAALALISHATELDPSDVDAWSNLGNVLRQLGRLDEALASYDRAIALNAGHALSYSNRANVLTKLERFEEALQGYEQAIAIAPDFVDAWSNRGILLHELGRLDDAIVSFDKAIQLDPDYAEAWSHRGGPLRELARFDEAIAGFDRAIALRPDFADAWYNRAVMLQEIGRVDEAIDNFDRALALDPDYVTAKLSRAYAHLFTGDFEQGWTGYELRWHVPDAYLPALPFDEASWHGEQDLAGRSILIHDEQGLGDTIQFCRYIGQLNALGARVLFAPRPSLVGLMRTLDFPCEIVAIEDGAHDVDYHCPIASLPLAFRTTLATIPSRPSYLHADPARAARWAERIGSHGFKIGICWQGRPGKVDIGRSFPLAALAPIARLPEVRLISLHRGSGEAQLASLPDGMTVEALGEDFDAGPDSFLDTAAAIAQCDLVITSDTSIAHLAGALGAPTWIALKRGCDWRWLADRSDSPWYPSVRLFRQSVAGDWAHVFNDIERALTSVLETRTDRIDRSL